jgi:alkylation response protein AidB-like acyl-CoA dehydrogenase
MDAYRNPWPEFKKDGKMKEIRLNAERNLPLTDLHADEARFAQQVKDFTEQFLAPLVRTMDEDEKLDTQLISKLYEQGLMSIEIPAAYEGKNNGFFKTVLAIEELAKVDPAVAVFVDVQNTLVNNALIRWGNQEQKDKYLPLMAKSMVGAFSITEKDAGSDAYQLKTVGRKTKGGYILSGDKHYVTNAAEAGLFVLFANIDSNRERGGITAFLIEKDQAQGLVIHQRERKLGIKASSTCGLTLNDVFVADENILGGPGKGSQVALEILTDGRIGIAAQMIGCAQGALDKAIEYSKERVQFGNPIASYQGIHFPIAQMYSEVNAGKLMVYNAARISETSHGSMEHFTYASMSKLYASEVAERVSSKALDIFGGIGYMKECPIEKYYRDAKIGKIYEGTSNIQLRSLAKILLKNFV